MLTPLLNGRQNKAGPPIGLFHPVFNIFTNGLKANETIPMDFRDTVRKFIDFSCRFYSGEKERKEKLGRLFPTLFGQKFTEVPGPEVPSDDVIIASKGEYNAYVLILVLNNEVGTGQSDPFQQAGRAYQKYWSDPKSTYACWLLNFVKLTPIFSSDKDLRLKSYCPTLLVSIAGPWICVAGGIYLKDAVVQPLTNYIWAGERAQSDYCEQSDLERIFFSLTTAVKPLIQYYTDSLPRAISNPEFIGPCGYPYVCEYEGKSFSYEQRLFEEDGKLVYKVKEGNEYRIVKFSNTYNDHAHRLLAEEVDGERLAPTLFYASSETYGGKRMIVMEYVEGCMLCDSNSFSSQQFELVKKAIARLHAEGIVFGDLREPNIMITKDTEKVMLVDFDWCAKDGEGTYPFDLNPDIVWARGVGPGAILRKKHDEFMLELLEMRN
jgi:predicted Ser/Thr protein kinase